MEHAALAAVEGEDSGVRRQAGEGPVVIVAVWTLESDNGTGDMGKLPVNKMIE